MAGGATLPGHPFRAALFDMDGVVTDTAEAHAAAWKACFDGFLERLGAARGEPLAPFDAGAEYHAHVDGKPRLAGVRDFLAARGIALPDPALPGETVETLAAAKNEAFAAWLAAHRARAFPDTLELIGRLRSAGLSVAVFSASRNAAAVLGSAGVLGLFDARVDGEVAALRGLAGKPDPAMLLAAAADIGAAPEACLVFEDAVAGVQAGRAGNFGLVVGVDRGGQAAGLRAAGAHLVLDDLRRLKTAPGGRLLFND